MTVDGNPIRTAIRTALLADTGLMAIASGVFYQLAPEGTDLPYVVYQEQSDGRPLWTMAGPPLETVQWLVKGVGSVAEAEDMHQRIRVVLDRAELTIEGHTNLYCNRVSNIAYPETSDGQRHQHVGSVYKITTEER